MATTQVRFHLPAPPLRELITAYYVVDVPLGHHLVDYLHPEWANIRFVLQGDWGWSIQGAPPFSAQRGALFGPTDRTATITASGGLLIGVGLLPLGWARLIGEDAGLYANRGVDLSGVLPGADALWADLTGRDEAQQVVRLDAYFSARLAVGKAPDPVIAQAHRALMVGDIGDVERFAAEAGIPVRRLQRLCRKTFGFAPKPLLRRQRFLRTLDQISRAADRPLSEGLDTGYYDQAHFIRDFRAFMGMTPTAYFALPREVLRRAAAERTRVVGASLQGLHDAPER
jgi:AraC-like DNA-binding protein